MAVDAASLSSLCQRLQRRDLSVRKTALQELGALPPEVRRTLTVPSGRYAGWPVSVMASRIYVDSRMWPQALFKPLLPDFTPADLSAPGPDGVPVGFWFWLGGMKRAVSDKNQFYDDSHFAFRNTLAEHWGEPALAQVVQQVMFSPLAQGAGSLPSLLRKAHHHEQRARMKTS